MVEEFKTYEATSGNFEKMRDRFIAEVVPRLASHGVVVVSAWEQLGDEPKLVYLTRAASEAALKEGWAAFGSDPEWKSIKTASEVDGPLLAQQSATRVTPLTLPPVKGIASE